MSTQTKIQKIQTALTQISNLNVYHYFAPSNSSLPYCVWYEAQEDSSLQANNSKAGQAIGGFVDYYTKTEFDSMFDSIQSALNGVENCYWEYESTIYGDPSSENNNTIHHTWSWRVL